MKRAVPAAWLRKALGVLHFQWLLNLRTRTQAGRVAPHLVWAVALVAAVGGVGVWSATRGDHGTGVGGPGTASTAQTGSDPVDTCKPTAAHPGPTIDLGVQAATSDPHHPVASFDQVRTLVRLAKQAGAQVISTSASFRTMQPTEDGPINYRTIDRTIGAATSAGLKVKLELVGMPDWALDDPIGDPHQPPRSDAELARWTTFVRAVMKHVQGKVAYLEVWNEPNEQRWWPTGPNPVEFDRLLQTSYEAVHAVSPSTQVVSGGLIGNDIGFLDKMYDAMKTIGLKNPPFDLLGVHPFTGSSPPDKVDPGKRYERAPFGLYDENYTGFTGLHEVMAKNGDADVPIYITEFGYDTRPAPRLKPVTDAQRASYLTMALEQATCVPYVADFSWYALHPSKWDPPGWTILDKANHPDLTYAALAAWGAAVARATGSGS